MNTNGHESEGEKGIQKTYFRGYGDSGDGMRGDGGNIEYRMSNLECRSQKEGEIKIDAKNMS